MDFHMNLTAEIEVKELVYFILSILYFALQQTY